MPESFPTPQQIHEHAPSPFETWLETEFPKQYEQRAKTLDRLGLLRILPESGTYGIVDTLGKECPFPEMEDVKKKLFENREFFEKKAEQGFTRLSIAPFGLPTARLFDTMKKAILKHKKEGTLLDTDGKPLDLDLNDPLYTWEGYENQEISCFPESFDRTDHNGKTKQQMLEGTQSFPGFLVSFLEDNLDIPREGRGETKGGRKRIETNKTPLQYLKLLKENPQYQGESGLTIEEWATLFLTNLEETNQVTDDYGNGKDSICWNLGTYFPAGGVVSSASWSRGSRQAGVGGNGARSRDEDDGSRVAVRV